jgi:hypothetical protein
MASAKKAKPSMKSPAVTSRDIKLLTDSVADVDLKVTKISTRLIGDDQMGTKGLIHEVSEAGETLRETRAVVFKQGDRLKEVEDSTRAQAEIFEDLRLVRLMANKFWKLAALFIAGGLLNPLVGNLFHAILTAFR